MIFVQLVGILVCICDSCKGLKTNSSRCFAFELWIKDIDLLLFPDELKPLLNNPLYSLYYQYLLMKIPDDPDNISFIHDMNFKLFDK